MAELLLSRAIFLGLAEAVGVRSAARLEKNACTQPGGYRFPYYYGQVFAAAAQNKI
jgi:hypothetical protein